MQRRRPRGAHLDDAAAQRREPLEHAVEHHAGEERLGGVVHRRQVLGPQVLAAAVEVDRAGAAVAVPGLGDRRSGRRRCAARSGTPASCTAAHTGSLSTWAGERPPDAAWATHSAPQPRSTASSSATQRPLGVVQREEADARPSGRRRRRSRPSSGCGRRRRRRRRRGRRRTRTARRRRSRTRAGTSKPSRSRARERSAVSMAPSANHPLAEAMTSSSSAAVFSASPIRASPSCDGLAGTGAAACRARGEVGQQVAGPRVGVVAQPVQALHQVAVGVVDGGAVGVGHDHKLRSVTSPRKGDSRLEGGAGGSHVT